MKITLLNKADKNYISDPKNYQVYVNNRLQLSCLFADDKKGVALCRNDQGCAELKRGEVEIVKIR